MVKLVYDFVFRYDWVPSAQTSYKYPEWFNVFENDYNYVNS